MDIAKELLDSAVHDVESRLGEVNRIQEVIQNLTVEAKSEDDLIQLTVGPPGYLRAMTLDPRVKRLDVETLAEKIITMVNNSSDLLREEIAEQIQALLARLRPDGLHPMGGRSLNPPPSRTSDPGETSWEWKSTLSNSERRPSYSTRRAMIS